MPENKNNSGFNSGSTGSGLGSTSGGSGSTGGGLGSSSGSLGSTSGSSGSTSGSMGSSSSSSGSSSGSSGIHMSADGIQGILKKIGVDENLINGMIDNWRSQLTQTLTSAIQETDLRDAFDKVRQASTGSADVVKNYSARNPKLFYSGVAAVLIGTGLIAAAAREAASDVEGSNLGTTSATERGL